MRDFMTAKKNNKTCSYFHVYLTRKACFCCFSKAWSQKILESNIYKSLQSVYVKRFCFFGVSIQYFLLHFAILNVSTQPTTQSFFFSFSVSVASLSWQVHGVIIHFLARACNCKTHPIYWTSRSALVPHPDLCGTTCARRLTHGSLQLIGALRKCPDCLPSSLLLCHRAESDSTVASLPLTS